MVRIMISDSHEALLLAMRECPDQITHQAKPNAYVFKGFTITLYDIIYDGRSLLTSVHVESLYMEASRLYKLQILEGA